MKRSGFAAGAFLAAVTSLALTGCGGSSSSPTTSSGGGGGSTPTSTPAVSVPAGSSFCLQSVSMSAQLSKLGSSLYSVSPGATPSVTAFKQLIAASVSLIDGLDGSAPSEIASSFHTLRNAYDQVNTKVQSVTSLEQLTPIFSSLATQPVKDAGTAVTAYLQRTCGAAPSP